MKLNPAELVLITDPTHPDYDPRVERPLNEERIRSIIKFGVVVPVKVKKIGDNWVVVDGRGRVKDTLEANRRLEKEGKPKILVECVEETRENNFETAIVSNTLREDDNPIHLAEKMRKYQLGKDRTPPKKRTIKEIATAFGKNEATIIKYLSLLMLHDDIQKDVIEGVLTMNDVVAWTKRDLETQLTLWIEYKASVGKVIETEEIKISKGNDAAIVVPGSASWYYDEPEAQVTSEPEIPDHDPDDPDEGLDRADLRQTTFRRRWTKNQQRLKGLTRTYMRDIISKIGDMDLSELEEEEAIFLTEVKDILKWVTGGFSNKEICKYYPPLDSVLD